MIKIDKDMFVSESMDPFRMHRGKIVSVDYGGTAYSGEYRGLTKDSYIMLSPFVAMALRRDPKEKIKWYWEKEGNIVIP